MNDRLPAKDENILQDTFKTNPVHIPEQKEHIPVDQMHRPLRDLRISVTDRCNLRCNYCMPREIFDKNHVFLPNTELLNFEEIERLAKLFVELGVKKIRLTGGEPLLRRDIDKLVALLTRLTDSEGRAIEVTLTSNGVLLAQKAQALRDAGISRLTVSLDGISSSTFKRMTDSDVPVATVLNGIAVAQRAGFNTIKINMVVKRGVNDHEIMPMAEHFRGSGHILRFIEYMDVGSSNGWCMDDVVTAQEILQRINAHYPLEPLGANVHGEVARRWRYKDGAGEIGVIASVTEAFCSDCTRIRLSTDGKLYTCLFATEGMDLKTPLRQGVAYQALSNQIRALWQSRQDQYSQLRHLNTDSNVRKIEMSYIGG
jgi:cyclic pyranopterin phosphate synthase